MLSSEQVKQALGQRAADMIGPDTTIGIGTGSTAYWFILALAERIRNGLNCRAVPTSRQTKYLAMQEGIPLVELDEVDMLNLTVDGADEIGPELTLIKGGGGALLQEKMVAAASARYLIIAGQNKQVEQLGKFPLPVEIVPYGWKHIQKQIELLGCKRATLRVKNEKFFVTDHGHFILDCYFEEITDTIGLHVELKDIPGVVEHGLFIDMADEALIGKEDGTITKLRR